MIVFPLPLDGELVVHTAARVVETRWPDGRRVGGTREATPDNIAQAVEQGYAADAAGCWASLTEHELLHSVTAVDLWPDRRSAALRHEAGDPRPYWARLYEEGVTIAAQAWLTGAQPTLPAPLRPYRHCLCRWRDAVTALRAALRVETTG
jgi:hypothetical protein